jgi:hypothetical protein
MGGMAFSESLRNARATAIRDAIDAGTGPGRIRFYTGPKPAAGAAISTQVLLGTAVFARPCGTIAGGILTFAALTDDPEADATGICAWARIEAGDGTFVADVDVTAYDGAGPVRLSSVDVVTGSRISVIGARIVEGNG